MDGVVLPRTESGRAAQTTVPVCCEQEPWAVLRWPRCWKPRVRGCTDPDLLRPGWLCPWVSPSELLSGGANDCPEVPPGWETKLGASPRSSAKGTDMEGEVAPILYPMGGVLAWTHTARAMLPQRGAGPGPGDGRPCQGQRQGEPGCPCAQQALIKEGLAAAAGAPWASCPRPE